MLLTTLCYIEKDDSYLMLHRDKKEKDLSNDMWIGVGGKFEYGESPLECLKREVREETGLTLNTVKFRGIVTFHSIDNSEELSEYMFLYTSDSFSGELAECDEGSLKFIPKNELSKLYFWSGDEIFLKLIRDNVDFFDLKLDYRGKTLKSAVLNGRNMELFDQLGEDFEPTGIVRERSVAHELGYLHRTVHIWVVRRENGRLKVLLQKRAMNKDSYPGYYDISSAGHIMAGDDYMISALREIREEIGIAANETDIIFIGKRRTNHRTEFYGRPFINNEISNIYLFDMTGRSDTIFELQKEEVEEVCWFDYREITDEIYTGRLKNCIFLDEWELLRQFDGEEEKNV